MAHKRSGLIFKHKGGGRKRRGGGKKVKKGYVHAAAKGPRKA
jgi:hypothetical protein